MADRAKELGEYQLSGCLLVVAGTYGDGTIGEIASMMQSYAWLRSKGMMLEDIKNQMKDDEDDTDTAKE